MLAFEPLQVLVEVIGARELVLQCVDHLKTELLRKGSVILLISRWCANLRREVSQRLTFRCAL